ncbi:MAG: hypothetical protein ACLTH3_06765 [Lachnospira sp.]
MKKRGNISIKAKLLGVITPVVIAIVVVLVLVSHLASAHIIENYSQNLLESSVENQTSKIESWLDENLSSFQMAKTTIEQLNPDDAQASDDFGQLLWLQRQLSGRIICIRQ